MEDRWKGHINRAIRKERTNTVFVTEWVLKTAVPFWPEDGPRVARDWPWAMNLNRKHRISTISNRQEIRHILDSGRRTFVKHIGVLFVFQENSDINKKAAILIKKSIGCAAKRNYVKRIFRHFIREHFDRFGRFNRVILIYNGKSDLNYNELKERLLPLIMGLWNTFFYLSLQFIENIFRRSHLQAAASIQPVPSIHMNQ